MPSAVPAKQPADEVSGIRATNIACAAMWRTVREFNNKLPAEARLALLPCEVMKNLSFAHGVYRVMHAASVVQRTQDSGLGDAIAEFLATMSTLWSTICDPPMHGVPHSAYQFLSDYQLRSDYQFPPLPPMFCVNKSDCGTSGGAAAEAGTEAGTEAGGGTGDGSHGPVGSDDDAEGSEDDDSEGSADDDSEGSADDDDSEGSEDDDSEGSDGSDDDSDDDSDGFGVRTPLDHLVILIRNLCNTMPGFWGRRVKKLRAAKAKQAAKRQAAESDDDDDDDGDDDGDDKLRAAKAAVKHGQPARDNHKRLIVGAVPAKVLVAESDDDTAAVPTAKPTAKQIRHGAVPAKVLVDESNDNDEFGELAHLLARAAETPHKRKSTTVVGGVVKAARVLLRGDACRSSSSGGGGGGGSSSSSSSSHAYHLRLLADDAVEQADAVDYNNFPEAQPHYF